MITYGKILRNEHRDEGIPEKQVRRICIPETYVSSEEAFALASMPILISLKCCMRDTSVYSDLPLTGNLTDICLMPHPKQYDSIQSYGIKLLTKNMVKLTVSALRVAMAVCIEKIVMFKNDPISDQEVATMAAIPTLTTIRCSITQVEQMIAVKLLQLKGITEAEKRVDRIRTEELVKIRSLKTLKSGFFCSKNIDLLAGMNQLETLILTVHPQGSLRKLFNNLALQKVQLTKYNNEIMELERVDTSYQDSEESDDDSDNENSAI
ncbi:hypothetical protein M5D96_005621 [Drosophila gunungcola]|uniref:Uncharacterized protein n=1 Tax=Drosophila gunungcola TaxID=103775 RepID=A0A9P9YRC5_9MUSC|nr:hypothetical protein M5D96_005621 [Drosophila gunungcola]